MSIALVDSGGANVASVMFALERLQRRAEVTCDPAVLRAASHVILPGVGAASDAMQRLRRTGLDRILPTLTQPVLGICLGLQLFYERSEEDAAVDCLGVLNGTVTRLPGGRGVSIPHMGWNQLERVGGTPLLDGIAADAWFYFVHSYAAPPGSGSVATARHGAVFTAVAQTGNFHATQFHPERSGAAGARLLANFLALR